MSLAVLASVALVGALGGVHCLGMCGGIVTALSVRMPGERPRPFLHLAYHAGRLSTYATGGAVAGGVGGGAMTLLEPFVPVQTALYVFAQFMLIAMGLYLLGIPRFLAAFERLGLHAWRRVQPFAARLLPVRTAPRAYVVGLAWGLLPCGLVYSMLATALVSGSAGAGAVFMLAFGLGTLPALLALGTVLPALDRWRRSGFVRHAAGGIVMTFGVVGLARVAHVGPESLRALLCLTP